MGLFDVGIKKKLTSKKSKEEILNTIKDEIKDFSEEKVNIKEENLSLVGFKSSILKYNLSINLDKSNLGHELIIDGELQQFYVWILIILVIVSILFTYGIGVILVVAFTYLQKQSSTKFINDLLKDIT